MAEENPQTNTGDGPHSPHEHGFTQNQEANLKAGHTLGAQQAEQTPPLNHGEGHGVINEKRSNDQREQTQGRQVELEGPRHLFDGLRAAARRQDFPTGWQKLTNRCQEFLPCLALGREDINPA